MTSQAQARLSWDPPQFNAGKLSVRYLDAPGCGGASTGARRYTLTHNDVTGALMLTVGADYDAAQVAGWYTRLLRDEVLAEFDGCALHVHVHVRGEGDWWLAPSPLRAFIFRREMPLVLDTLRFADREFLLARAAAAEVPVLVHYHEDGRDRVESLGHLFEAPVLASAALRGAQAPPVVLRRRRTEESEVLVGRWVPRSRVPAGVAVRASARD